MATENKTSPATEPLGKDGEKIMAEAIREEIRALLAAALSRLDEEISRVAAVAASPYLNRTDTAAWAGCSISKIAVLTKKGKLKPKYLGGQPLYEKKQLEALIKQDTDLMRKRRAAEIYRALGAGNHPNACTVSKI